jgi:hypothetical protein
MGHLGASAKPVSGCLRMDPHGNPKQVLAVLFSVSVSRPKSPRSALQRIYACDACYKRAKLFLSRCEPGHQKRLSFANVRAFFSSVMLQGLLGKRA